MAEIGQRIGYTRQATWELLSNHGRDVTPLGIITCCHCGAAVVRGHDQLRNNGPVPCLDCLAKQPDAPFGLRLKAFRMTAGLTQAALAKLAGFVPLTISAYERGDDEPRWTNLVKLMRVLGTDLVTVGMTDDRRRFRPRKPR
jgi:DNA-binding XRE family transcriptional regulator